MTKPIKKTPPLQKVTERERIIKREAMLVNERSSWFEHWRELNDYILPRRLRYLANDTNKGSKRNGKIYNGKATKAARTMAAGKMAGQTSPARPWYRYSVPGFENDQEVQSWLRLVEKRVREAMDRSNIYACLYELWFMEGVFGTATMFVEEDDADDIRGYVFPLGMYCLASTGKRRADVIFGRYRMTVEQVVVEYGLENVLDTTRIKWENQQYDDWIDVIHVIEPNLNRQTGKIDNANMPWRSRWFEAGSGAVTVTTEDDKALRISGFEEKPFFVARWNVIGDDVYGSDCPGMDALGDTKSLQFWEKNKAEAGDKMVRPPYKAPVSARAARLSLLPDDVSYVDETAQGAKFEKLIDVRPESVTVAGNAVRDHETRVVEAFFADLFLMMLNDPRQQPATAREINERHEEKMLQLGPVVERDHNEVLNPLHRRMVNILARRGKLPPIPKQVQGKSIRIEYTSIMAQAQKLLGTASKERFLSLIGSTSAVKQDVLDIPNFDKIMRNYADMLGLDPDEVNAEDAVKALREARAQAQQAAQAQQNSLAAVQGAKVASETDMTGDNMLTRLMQGVGYGSPTPGRA